MRRNIGRHTDSDTGSAVDQKLGEFSWQNGGLFERFVVVWNEVDGFFVDILEHELRNFGHADFGVTHGSGGVAVDGAEVSVPVSELVAHGKILRHTNNRVINGSIAVRVVFTENFTDDTRGFFVGL